MRARTRPGWPRVGRKRWVLLRCSRGLTKDSNATKTISFGPTTGTIFSTPEHGCEGSRPAGRERTVGPARSVPSGARANLGHEVTAKTRESLAAGPGTRRPAGLRHGRRIMPSVSSESRESNHPVARVHPPRLSRSGSGRLRRAEPTKRDGFFTTLRRPVRRAWMRAFSDASTDASNTYVQVQFKMSPYRGPACEPEVAHVPCPPELAIAWDRTVGASGRALTGRRRR